MALGQKRANASASARSSRKEAKVVAKLTLWICLGLCTLAITATLAALCCLNWPVLAFALAIAVFFAAAAWLIQPAVDRVNEAAEQDKLWRDAYRNQRL